ncbi:MAG: hypothetical protein JO256_08140 [Alphaproteobacteria bacterium]|nr:hypothetical protein [Alphaproteobacteria bacterium]
MERADFKALRILLVSEKNHGAQTLRAVMQMAGITRLTSMESPRRALEVLSMDHYDAVFCSESCEQVGELSFPLAVRQTRGVLNPLIPVFVFQERARRRDVEAARDIGATDFLTCPISPKTVMTKLTAAIANPRPFIKATEYFGPDRRAKMRPSWGGDERRSRTPKKIKVLKPGAASDSVLI